jgi:TRAP-type C4-dicarboxylate transport system substrate-binding protein
MTALAPARRAMQEELMGKASILGSVSVFALVLVLGACAGGETTTTTTTVAITTTMGSVPTTVAATTTSTYPEGTWTFTFDMPLPAADKIALVSEMWQSEISSRTHGAVRFEYFPGASLTAAGKVYDGVLTGISDIGFFALADMPGAFPVMEFLDMPNGYASGYVATMAANDFYNGFRPAELDQVQVLALSATGPHVLLTTGKAVRTLADVEGLVLGGAGVDADVAALLGADGYAATPSGVYDLMSQGVIAGTIAPRAVLLGQKQAEVVKCVTECFAVGSTRTMCLVMNKDRWGQLPADIQRVFTDVSREFIEDWAKVASAKDYDAMASFQAQPGREVIDLVSEEAAIWKMAVRPLIDDKLVAIHNATNGYEAFLLDRMEHWTTSAPSDAECSAWAAENVVAPAVP